MSSTLAKRDKDLVILPGTIPGVVKRCEQGTEIDDNALVDAQVANDALNNVLNNTAKRDENLIDPTLIDNLNLDDLLLAKRGE